MQAFLQIEDDRPTSIRTYLYSPSSTKLLLTQKRILYYIRLFEKKNKNRPRSYQGMLLRLNRRFVWQKLSRRAYCFQSQELVLGQDLDQRRVKVWVNGQTAQFLQLTGEKIEQELLMDESVVSLLTSFLKRTLTLLVLELRRNFGTKL